MFSQSFSSYPFLSWIYRLSANRFLYNNCTVLLGFWDFVLWYMIPAVYYLFHSYWFGLQRSTETWFIWHNSHCFKVLLQFLLITQFSLVKFLYESLAIRRMRENAHYCFHVMKISIDFIEIVQHSNSVLFHFFSKLFEWPIAVLS